MNPIEFLRSHCRIGLAAGVVFAAVLGSASNESGQSTAASQSDLSNPFAAGPRRAVASSTPIERLSDGSVSLGSTLQEKGLWLPLDRTELGRRSTLAPVDMIPFQP